MRNPAPSLDPPGACRCTRGSAPCVLRCMAEHNTSHSRSCVRVDRSEAPRSGSPPDVVIVLHCSGVAHVFRYLVYPLRIFRFCFRPRLTKPFLTTHGSAIVWCQIDRCGGLRIFLSACSRLVLRAVVCYPRHVRVGMADTMRL